MNGLYHLLASVAICTLVLLADAYLYRRRRYQRYREFCEYIDRRTAQLPEESQS